jgi:hypothetical protein
MRQADSVALVRPSADLFPFPRARSPSGLQAALTIESRAGLVMSMTMPMIAIIHIKKLERDC